MTILPALVAFVTSTLRAHKEDPSQETTSNLAERLEKISGQLELISKTLDELLKATNQISETLVEVAIQGPSLPARGHVERSIRAMGAGLDEMAISELAKAEALDPRRWEIWFTFLLIRLMLSRRNLEERLRSIPHEVATEIKYCILLLNSEKNSI